MKCSQCGRQAVVQLDGGAGPALCVEHYSMFTATINEQQRNNMAMINYYRDQIHEIMGVPPPSARIDVPRQVINHSPVTNNNIRIDRSVIGAVNTAQVGRIEVAMKNISNAGNEELNEALKTLTEAVLNSNELKDNEKEQVVEELAFLAEQATLPKDQQQKTVIKMVIKAIPQTLTAAADLTTLWTVWGPHLHAFFK